VTNVALLEIRTNPTRRELQWFGVLLLLFGGVVGALLRWQSGSLTVARDVWITFGLVAAVYYAVPITRRPLFVGWIYATYPIGWVLSHVVLAAIFYIVFTAVGTLLRVFGYDPLGRRIDRSAPSYWVAREPLEDVQRYFRQY
jgi:carbamoyltransferase